MRSEMRPHSRSVVILELNYHEDATSTLSSRRIFLGEAVPVVRHRKLRVRLRGKLDGVALAVLRAQVGDVLLRHVVLLAALGLTVDLPEVLQPGGIPNYLPGSRSALPVIPLATIQHRHARCSA